jgi:predicted HAD superfamily hydrolase
METNTYEIKQSEGENICMFIKERLYDIIVRNNKNVKYEYERYVMEHTIEHYEHRLTHWKILWKLNWHYRIQKKTVPMLFFDIPWIKEGASMALEQPQDKSKGAFYNESKNEEKQIYPSESTRYLKSRPHWYAMEILSYDIISFDIFDTLIFRPFSNPQSLFVILGEQLGILGFYSIRINAEKQARELKYVTYGNKEVTIRDIYKIIEKKTGLDAEYGVSCEIELEKKFCFANPYMKQLYELLKYQKKQLIAVSDMYLSSKDMQEILEKCGYDYFEEIIVSCEYQCSKADGTLYDVVKSKFTSGGQSIIHIGDNENGDIKQAKEKGLTCRLYENVNKAQANLRTTNMSLLVGSAYRGIVNSYLHNGLYSYSHAFEYGFSVGGIYILGYMEWLYEKVCIHQIDKILFVARDGDIYKKVFNYLHPSIRSEYLFWSRITSEMVVPDRMSFINRFINEKMSAKIVTSVGEIMESLGLEILLKDLDKYGLSPELPICKDTQKLLTDFIASNWEEISEILLQNTEQVKRYVNRAVQNTKKVAIVDVGWTGMNILKLKRLIQEVSGLRKENIFCFLAGCTTVENGYLESEGQIHSYLFSYQYNKDNFDKHHKSKKPSNNMFEIMTQAKCASFITIQNGKFIFDIPEVENYKDIEEIQEGIIKFIEIWLQNFKEYSYMMKISGHDAYQPFAQKLNDYSYFKNCFPDFSISMKVLSNVKAQRLETVKEII